MGSALTDCGPLKLDLLSNDPKEFFEKIKQITNEARKVLKEHKDRKAKEKIWYLNKKTQEKNFDVNEFVTYQNVKVQAGKSLAIKNHPAVIISKSACIAYIRDLVNDRYSKQSFNHINKYEHDEELILPPNWQEDIINSTNANRPRRSSRNQRQEPLEQAEETPTNPEKTPTLTQEDP